HARDRLGATVRLMPAGDPPHRPAPGATAEHRARMLELAIAGEPGLQVDRRELERATPSWTADTLRGIRAELGPEHPVALLVGADSLLGLPGWKDWRAVPELAHLVVASRPGLPLDGELPPALAGVLEERWTEYAGAQLRDPAVREIRLDHPMPTSLDTAVWQ